MCRSIVPALPANVSHEIDAGGDLLILAPRGKVRPVAPGASPALFAGGMFLLVRRAGPLYTATAGRRTEAIGFLTLRFGRMNAINGSAVASDRPGDDPPALPRRRPAAGRRATMRSRPSLVYGVAAALLLVLAAAENGQAQNISVQQPVFSTFSAGTTVSVPDRGTVFLGGVGRAGESRRFGGPLRSGTSTGLFREHAGVSATATIHDFEEMDRLLLGEGSAGTASGTRLSAGAEHAWESLSRQHAGPTRQPVNGRTGAGGQAAATPSTSANDRQARGEKFYQLGLRAVSEGRLTVARLHFRMAEKNGFAVPEGVLASAESPEADRRTPAP